MNNLYGAMLNNNSRVVVYRNLSDETVVRVNHVTRDPTTAVKLLNKDKESGVGVCACACVDDYVPLGAYVGAEKDLLKQKAAKRASQPLKSKWSRKPTSTH